MIFKGADFINQMKKYYLDTSIYIDYYENRTDRFRPLGDWAHRLLALIETENSVLLISDILIAELGAHFSKNEVKEILETYQGIIKKVEFTKKQIKEARKISNEKKIPFGDVLHVIIARDNEAILVTRDHHMEEIQNITIFKKPEDII